ncbi:MAG: hypothetical protein NWS86_04310 [Flavobacteriales bacterium]|nr:hypothetical protein [Flavobacteriales bacterium]
MHDLLLHMQSVLHRMNAGNLHAEELNEAVESARMLYERLIVIRHRAFDRLGKGDSLASAYNFRLDRYVAMNQTSLFDAIHEIEVEKSKGEQSRLFTLEDDIQDLDETATENTTEEESPAPDLSALVQESAAEVKMDEVVEVDEAAEEIVPEEKEPLANDEEEIAVETEEMIEEGPASVEEEVPSKETLIQETPAAEPPAAEVQKEALSEKSLAEKLEKTPLSDLKSAIGLNRKFQFINTLFDGDGNAYDNAVQFLNKEENSSEISTWLADNLPASFEDEDQQNVLDAFLELVERRHS